MKDKTTMLMCHAIPTFLKIVAECRGTGPVSQDKSEMVSGHEHYSILSIVYLSSSLSLSASGDTWHLL